MKDISESLTNAIFTVCNKAISNAKFDKTYKCRVVNKVSDNKYIVVKDNVEHAVDVSHDYETDQVVRVLLPQNSWTDAFIIFP